MDSKSIAIHQSYSIAVMGIQQGDLSPIDNARAQYRARIYRDAAVTAQELTILAIAMERCGLAAEACALYRKLGKSANASHCKAVLATKLCLRVY